MTKRYCDRCGAEGDIQLRSLVNPYNMTPIYANDLCKGCCDALKQTWMNFMAFNEVMK